MAKKLSFEEWKRLVNAEITRICGMDGDDIDDWCYSADYADGRTPLATAKRAIKNSRDG